MKSLLTLPLCYSNLSMVQNIIKNSLTESDAFEIWLDALPKDELNPERILVLVRSWKKLSKKKLVIVCKDEKERGKFIGTQERKVVLLLAAAKGGADYVDIGLHAGEKNIAELMGKKGRTKVIVSFHDFQKTPSAKRLQQIAGKIAKLGADIIKIATFVNSLEDNERLMDLALELKRKKQKHIVIGMGEKGMVTRIFGQKMGNELDFVSLETETAPGQLTLEQALEFKKVLR